MKGKIKNRRIIVYSVILLLGIGIVGGIIYIYLYKIHKNYKKILPSIEKT